MGTATSSVTHEVRFNVMYDPYTGEALAWSVRACDCTTPQVHLKW